MTHEEFRAFLTLLMCSDPWPLAAEEDALLNAFADRHAKSLGFQDWIEAYHALRAS